MKATVNAKTMSAVLGAAALLVDPKTAKKIHALEAVHLVAKDDAIIVTINALDFALTMTMSAVVETAGEVAVSAPRLGALAAGFPANSEISIGGDDKTASIACGRARFRLSTMPIGDLPSMPEIGDAIGRVELARGQLLELIKKTAFAISTEETRYYLKGVFIRDADAGLTFVSTDGHRLARVILPGIGGLSQDYRLIVPLAAIKIIAKLLADKTIETVTLRRSKTLIEVVAAPFTFVSKLVDGTYPDYQRLVPAPSGNTAMVDRAELARAIERVAAVAPEKAAPTVGLLWTAEEPGLLHLCVPGAPGLADDPIEAETSGNGRAAVQVRYAAELVDELGGARVCIDVGDSPGAPILITTPADTSFLAIQMPCTWGVDISQINEPNTRPARRRAR